MNTSDTVDFSTPADVLKIVQTLEDAGKIRSQNRAMIHAQFDGSAPYTPKEVDEHQIQFNVNKLGGYKIALDATAQVNGALMNKDRFFNARCVAGKVEHREKFSQIFTTNIHRPIKRGRSGKKHLFLMMNRDTSLVMEGVGALVWTTRDRWIPKFVPLDDLLIPTDATLDLSEELTHFGVNSYMTPYQLYKLTHGKGVQAGWNMKLVDNILTSIPAATPFTPEILNRPEEMESLWKQHSGLMNSDAVPKVKVTFFYYQNTETGKWHRKILFRQTAGINVESQESDEFLFDGKDSVFADDIDQILHVQFGTGNVTAPLKFHSIRGLGVLLYAVIEADNRLYCQFMQSLFEQMQTILRIENPTGQDRPKMLQLHPYAVLEQGVSFVPPQERNQIDPRYVEMGMAQNRQLLVESSSSYVQDIDNGTRREQTLGEAQIKLQSSNKIVGSMLSNMYWQEVFYYEEIVRRFLLPAPTDPEVVTFQKKCEQDGIPKELMKPESWEVDAEKVFGMGDQTLAVQEVTALMAIVPQLDPTAQMTVRRLYIATITRNPDLAMQLVPEQPNQANQGRQMAEDVFATLMLGIPVAIREGIEQQDYIMAMAEMMAVKVEWIKNSPSQMGEPQDIIGLHTVEQDIMKHIELLAQNPEMKAFVAGMSKQVGKMSNDVKAFAQRQQQAQEAKAAKEQEDPEAMAKVKAMQAQTEAKINASVATTTQKLEASAAKHTQEMKQASEKHMLEISSQAAQVSADLAAKQAMTHADLIAKEAQTKASIEQSKAKAKSKPAEK